MGERFRWYEGGTSDPVDRAVRNVEPEQVRDPLPRERPQLLISDELTVEINDPLQLMLDCELLDEVNHCARGTHYDELVRRSRSCITVTVKPRRCK